MKRGDMQKFQFSKECTDNTFILFIIDYLFEPTSSLRFSMKYVIT